MTSTRKPVGKLPIVRGSKKHDILLYLRSHKSQPMTLNTIIEMNPKRLADARRTRELLKELVATGLAVILSRDVYQITDHGVKVLYALAARDRGIMVQAPT